MRRPVGSPLESPVGPGPGWTNRVLPGLLVVSGLLLLGIFLLTSTSALSFPYPINDLEGTEIARAWMIRDGPSLYSDPSPEHPWVSTGPPLYLSLVSLGHPRPEVSLFVGRLISLLAAIGIILCVGWLLRSAGWVAVIAGPAVLLSFWEFLTWGGLLQDRTLGVFLGLLGVVLVRKRVALGIPAAACFILGLACHHDLVAAPLAAYGALALRDPGRGIRQGLLFIAAGVVVGGFGIWATDGGLARHLLVYSFLDFRWALVWEEFLRFVMTARWPLLLLTIAGVPWLWRRDTRWVVLYLAGGFFSAIMIGQGEAYTNRLLEWCVGLGLLAGVLAGSSRPQWVRSAVLALILIQAAVNIWDLPGRSFWPGWRENVEGRDRKVLAFMTTLEGEILAENPYYPVALGRRTWLLPRQLPALLRVERFGGLGTEIVSRIRERRFAAVQRDARLSGERVVFANLHLPGEYHELIETHYRFVPDGRFKYTGAGGDTMFSLISLPRVEDSRKRAAVGPPGSPDAESPPR